MNGLTDIVRMNAKRDNKTETLRELMVDALVDDIVAKLYTHKEGTERVLQGLREDYRREFAEVNDRELLERYNELNRG